MNILGRIFTNRGLNHRTNLLEDFLTLMSFPTIRRMSATLLGNDLVRVQPMGLPSGVVFYFTNEYTITGSNTFRILPYPPMSNKWIKKPDTLYGLAHRVWEEHDHPFSISIDVGIR